jgi:hypothetical protein
MKKKEKKRRYPVLKNGRKNSTSGREATMRRTRQKPRLSPMQEDGCWGKCWREAQESAIIPGQEAT